MRFIPQTMVALVAAAISIPVLAQSADTRAAQSLAATCANCHGTGGQAQGKMPVLAGMSKPDIVQRMNEFRDGKRPATIMHQIAKGYTAEQVDVIAAWFAAQKAR